MTLKTSQIIFSFVLISTTSAFAQEYSERQFLTDVVEQHDSNVEMHNKGFFSHVPTGLTESPVPPECDATQFENTTLQTVTTSTDYFTAVNAYFKKCGNILARSGTTGLPGLLKFALHDYSFFKHPQIREMTIALKNGVKIPAILALKKDSRPRPLVIVRCGVFCSSDESTSIINYLIHLYDQSPFNVLILSNRTGEKYIKNNHFFSIGGWEEGLETLEVANWMKDKWEYKNRISSLHSMGISLGGNSAIIGSYYNDTVLRDDGSKTFNSVTAICPAINLKPTLDQLYNKNIVGPIYGEYTKIQFKNAKKHLHDVPEMLNDLTGIQAKEIPGFIGDLASAALKKRGVAVSPEEFFSYNYFLNYPTVKTPLLVWASKDDLIVSNRVNTQAFANDPRYINSNTSGVLNLDYGTHCAFSTAYGFRAASTVLRDFVLVHSPEFLPSYKLNKIRWSAASIKPTSSQTHVEQSWKFKDGSSKAKVTFKLFDDTLENCYLHNNPYAAPPNCYVNRTYKVSVNDLKHLGASVPRNDVEAQSMTRYFNANANFYSENGPLNGTNSRRIYLTWRDGF